MRFDLVTLDSGERSLPFGLLVFVLWLNLVALQGLSSANVNVFHISNWNG